jgi:hypothetical protein
MPLDKTLAMAKRIVDLRTQLTVKAIGRAMAAAKASPRWGRPGRHVPLSPRSSRPARGHANGGRVARAGVGASR